MRSRAAVQYLVDDDGADPKNDHSLTFTRAAAAECADRRRLGGRWIVVEALARLLGRKVPEIHNSRGDGAFDRLADDWDTLNADETGWEKAQILDPWTCGSDTVMLGHDGGWGWGAAASVGPTRPEPERQRGRVRNRLLQLRKS